MSLSYPAGRDAEVRAFYTELLGLEEIPAPATLRDRQLVWFTAGSESLEIHFFPGAVDATHGRHISFDVTDLNGLRRRLLERGYGTYDGTPIPNRPRFFCRDPFGNLLEFTTLLGDYRE